MRVVFLIINTIISLLILLIFIYTLLGYFLRPYHPIRRTIGRVVEPMLTPIRQRISPMGGLDFSPLILMIILEVIRTIIASVIRNYF